MFAARLADSYGKSRIAVVSDENVAALYRIPLDEILTGSGLSFEWIVFPAGEKTKSIENLSCIIGTLMDWGFSRDDVILAFGGGVIGDLAGFAASTYLRGIRWLYIPTTLLAQSDASIGGKVGIHYRGIKNVIGAFHQPSMVLIDPDFLHTLPSREFFNGLAEIMKMAILPSGEKFRIWDDKTREAVFKREPAILTMVIEEACRLKASIVESDEFDRAGRIVLNLGHTIGHALESSGGFEKFTHGEAVSIGILFMSELSNEKGDMKSGELEKIRNLFMPITREIPTFDISWRKLVDLINMDKKRRGGYLNWVYPLGIGNVAIRTFADDELENTWDNFVSEFGRRFGRV
jgi:3-dehydroquinate synthase